MVTTRGTNFIRTLGGDLTRGTNFIRTPGGDLTRGTNFIRTPGGVQFHEFFTTMSVIIKIRTLGALLINFIRISIKYMYVCT